MSGLSKLSQVSVGGRKLSDRDQFGEIMSRRGTFLNFLEWFMRGFCSSSVKLVVSLGVNLCTAGETMANHSSV